MSSLPELAAQAWPILILWAEKYKEPIPYKGLLKVMHHEGFSNVGGILFLIREYCDDHGVGGLPRLSSIVVNVDEGVPTNGDEINKRVYTYPWHQRPVPTVQDFEKYMGRRKGSSR
jgi:hypothetical protein